MISISVISFLLMFAAIYFVDKKAALNIKSGAGIAAFVFSLIPLINLIFAGLAAVVLFIALFSRFFSTKE